MTRGEVIRHPGGVAAVRSPVFRHAGSWRHAGTVRRASHQSHPGGGAGLSRPPWHVSCCVSMLCVAITACHHLRGGILGRPSAVPACRRHPGRRNTGLRTAATPAGVAEMSASGHRPTGGGGADAALRPAVRRWGALWLHRRKATRWRA